MRGRVTPIAEQANSDTSADDFNTPADDFDTRTRDFGSRTDDFDGQMRDSDRQLRHVDRKSPRVTPATGQMRLHLARRTSIHIDPHARVRNRGW